MLGRLRLGETRGLPERMGLTSALSGEGTTFLAAPSAGASQRHRSPRVHRRSRLVVALLLAR